MMSNKMTYNAMVISLQCAFDESLSLTMLKDHQEIFMHTNPRDFIDGLRITAILMVVW